MIEGRSRNDRDADLANEVFGKFDIVGKTEIGNIGHYVIRPIRQITLKSDILEHRYDKVTFAEILADVISGGAIQ